MVLANNIGGRGRQLLLPCAIYGAFTFLAMALEKNEFFVAAGYVLLVAAVVMGLYFYKKDQSLVSFRFLLSIFWTAGEGLGVMQLSHLQSSWTSQAWLSFSGFYLLFLAGYEGIEAWLSRRAITLKTKVRHQKRSHKEQFQNRLFRCIRIVSLVTFATFVLEAVILGYVPLFSTETHAYDHFHISGVHYFTVSCMFTHSLTLIYLLMYTEKKKKTDSRLEKGKIDSADCI